FQGPGQFPYTMDKVRETAVQVMGWEGALDRNAGDVAALVGLGTYLFEQESYEDSRDLLNRARTLDSGQPGPDRKKTRMLVGIIQNSDHKFGEAEKLPKEALPPPPAGGQDDAKVLYILGRTYVAWGRFPEARAAMQRVLDSPADAAVAQKARETLVTLE